MLLAIALSSAFITLEPAKSQEKIEVTPLIQSSSGFGGKKSHIQDRNKLKLRLLKVNIPVGLKTHLHIHPTPMLVYTRQGNQNTQEVRLLIILALENHLLKAILVLLTLLRA